MTNQHKAMRGSLGLTGRDSLAQPNGLGLLATKPMRPEGPR